MKATQLSLRIWFATSAVFAVGAGIYDLWDDSDPYFIIIMLCSAIAAGIGSLPALVIMMIAVHKLKVANNSLQEKIQSFIWMLFFITLLYAIAAGIMDGIFWSGSFKWTTILQTSGAVTAILFACALMAFGLNFNKAKEYFCNEETAGVYEITTPSLLRGNENKTYMEPNHPTAATDYEQTKPFTMNKTLTKGLITFFLIIGLMIPTFLISNLVTERQDRNKKITEEANNRWASAQTISGPYLYIPYKDNSNRRLIILPENANVEGNILPEDRYRSIYKIIFYKSRINAKGRFNFQLPKGADTASLDFSNVKLCLGISDFKGIEEAVSLTFNDTTYELSPGLPSADIDAKGLSAAVNFSVNDLNQNIPFSYSLKLKGSGKLQFLPLSGNASYTLKSTWSKPSFIGSSAPNESTVTDSGFISKWSFNKANLPYRTILENGEEIKKSDSEFGVSILQPIDNYDKTARCIKYAILFIGLTFSLFFIIEIMQKKAMHPVQYVLAGLALVIFFTLLLSISEVIEFGLAYLISAGATILLIALYTKSHFRKWQTASIFGGVLAGLYGFNYVLISLEDTALLVGSIALFIILAIVMYISRKINWYRVNAAEATPANVSA